MSAVLEVTDLRVTFPSEEGPVNAVRGINLSLGDRDSLAIVGESGSGKSVTALALMGLLPDHARVRGSIKLNGRELLGLGDRELSRLRGRTVSMVFQDPLSALTPVYRVGDQIAEALLAHEAVPTRKAALARAVELLELVGIPMAAERALAFPHEFSGGMRQRVVIAIAIANDPQLIICDEPTTALDVTVQAQILALLGKARDLTGASVITITHDLAIAAAVSDRTAVMYAGRIVETGPTQQILNSPRMPYTVGLLGSIPRLDAPPRVNLLPIAGSPPPMHDLPKGCPFHPRCPVGVDACTNVEPALDVAESAHGVACIRHAELSQSSVESAFEPPSVTEELPDDHPVVLNVQSLAKTYSRARGFLGRQRVEVKAVEDVSLTVRAGRTLALVGESGSGKSTVLTEIMNLVAPESGSVSLFGIDATQMTGRQRAEARARVQIVFQDPSASLDPRLPIADLVGEPLRIAGTPDPFVRERIPELLELVGLRSSLADRYPADLSGGQRQRVCIARALALEPTLLVLDEPVSSLDVSIQAGILNLLRELQRERGLAYLFVSHDLSVVRNLAHDVAVMYRGRIVESGPADEVLTNPQHEYTRALLAAVPKVPV